jgi:hypothetical protein
MCNCNRPLCNECQGFEKAHKTVPHKHAAVIKAWADGIPVQMRRDNGDWRDMTLVNPAWDAHEYRVKPTPKPLEDVAHDAFYASCDKEFGGHHWRAVADAVVAAYKERGGS